MKKTNHILVIRLSAMGDVAMVVPVLKVFTETYPEVKITVLTRSFFKPLFEDLKNVAVFEADVANKHKGFLGLLKLSKEINEQDFDAIADLHNVIRSKIITKCLWIFGKKTATLNKGRTEKKALTRESNKEWKPLKSMHQRYADVFKKLGYLIDVNKFTPFLKKELPKDTSYFSENKLKKTIGIAPFAAYKSKTYPLDLMNNILLKLDKTQQFSILLFGGGTQEINQLNEFENRYSSVKNVAGKFHFKEELSLISNLDAMLAMDSGNGHLSALFGVPTVTLWGVTHPFLGFSPFKQPKENQFVSNRNEFPKIPTSVYGNVCPPKYENAMKTILPELVVERILTICSI